MFYYSEVSGKYSCYINVTVGDHQHLLVKDMMVIKAQIKYKYLKPVQHLSKSTYELTINPH